MDEQLRGQWRAIETFALDDAGAALPFSKRLARDHGWSLPFTEQAIREYKRFVFLALHAGHPTTPSEAVDQVWHEHLTYTRNYWEQFCGKVLGRPLHHEPTRGGPDERTRYHAQYENTLASYRRLFGQEPPSAFWPPAAVRFRRPEPLTQVQPGRYWLVRKPARGVVPAAAVAGLSLALAGCATLKQVWPWSLGGGEFLRLYVVLLVGGLAGAWVLRTVLRGGTGRAVDAAEEDAVDVYLQAFVAGREQRVVLAALTRCVDANCVSVSSLNNDVQVRLTAAAPAFAHPVESALIGELEHAGGSLSLTGLQTRLAPVLQPLAEEAEARGWILPAAERRRAWLWPLALGAAPLLLGVSRLVQGLSAGRPVGFLIVLLIVGVIAGLMLLIRRPWLSRSGQARLKAWRREKRELRRYKTSDREVAEAHGGPAASVALFGVDALSGMLMYHSFVQITRPAQSGGDSYGLWGDSGGGGGDSSSGGDSGDSGGGGDSGCGGCGGGD